MLNHYVYQITYNTGKKYIGVRSCKCSIEEDQYMGSACHLPGNLIGCKEILSVHDSRSESMAEEIRLHALYDVKNNPNFYNQCNATSTKFQASAESIKKSAEARKGRTKETHAYIAKQVEARAAYKGNGLTLAQKNQWLSSRLVERAAKYAATLAKTMEDPIKAAKITEARIRGGKSCTGVANPKKAHLGLNHPRAEAWWYKAPDGNITVVNNSIRGYCKQVNMFPVSGASIMRYIRTHKVPSKMLNLGWDFGLINEQEVTTPVE